MNIKVTIGALAFAASLCGSVIVRDRQIVELIALSSEKVDAKFESKTKDLDEKIDQRMKRDDFIILMKPIQEGIFSIQTDIRALNNRIDKVYKP